jgi:hypothetical protein
MLWPVEAWPTWPISRLQPAPAAAMLLLEVGSSLPALVLLLLLLMGLVVEGGEGEIQNQREEEEGNNTFSQCLFTVLSIEHYLRQQFYLLKSKRKGLFLAGENTVHSSRFHIFRSIMFIHQYGKKKSLLSVNFISSIAEDSFHLEYIGLNHK